MPLQLQLSKTSIRKEYHKKLIKRKSTETNNESKNSSDSCLEVKQKSKVRQMTDFLEKSINLYYSDINTKPENTVEAIYAEATKRKQLRLERLTNVLDQFQQISNVVKHDNNCKQTG